MACPGLPLEDTVELAGRLGLSLAMLGDGLALATAEELGLPLA